MPRPVHVLSETVAVDYDTRAREETVKKPPQRVGTHGEGDGAGYYDAGERMSAFWVGYWGLPY